MQQLTSWIEPEELHTQVASTELQPVAVRKLPTHAVYGSLHELSAVIRPRSGREVDLQHNWAIGSSLELGRYLSISLSAREQHT